MPQRHETTPPWGKKRKRELSSSPSPPPPDTSVPREHEEIKRLKTEQDEARPPWAKHSDPLSPSSLTSSAAWRGSKHNDNLTRAVKGMFDWTRSDEPVEESIRHMRRIVSLCQEEASGLKNWKRVIATYQSLGATPEDIDDLIDAREPFWTQTRVRHVSGTLATPRALADSIRTMVEESERSNGRYLDRELKDQLMKAVDRVFPRAPPVLVAAQSPALGGQPTASEKHPASTQYQAPVAQMARNSGPTPVSLPPACQVAKQQASSDPRLKSRHAAWAPTLDDTKPRADSLTEASSRKSSAATLVLESPAEPSHQARPSQIAQSSQHKPCSQRKPSSQHSRSPSPDLSQVIKPKHPTRFTTEPARPVNTETWRNQRPPSPSASPKLAGSVITPSIQFNIATGSHSAPLRPRPRLGLDVDVASTSSGDVLATPSSAASTERRKSALNSMVQPPTRPRSLPLFQAKIVPKEPLNNTPQQKNAILRDCDNNNIPAQDATPCPSDDRTWVLHFKGLADLHLSLGKQLVVRDISLTVLTYALDQYFQTFAIEAPSSLATMEGEIDTINAIARTFRPRAFVMKRRANWRDGVLDKWIVVFEEPIHRDSFTLDTTVAGRREPLEFFALSSDCIRCWVCDGQNHNAAYCRFASRIVLPHKDRQYLCFTPQLH